MTDFVAALLDEFSDDIYGLWEFDWGLNSRGFAPAFGARLRLLSSLVELGLIDVFYGELQLPREPALAKEVAIQALINPQNWEPRSSHAQNVYFLTTSELGLTERNAYLSRKA